MGRLPLNEAARAAGASPSTARGWKRRALAEGDDWDAAREAAARAEGGLGGVTDQVLIDFTRVFHAVMRGIRELPPDEAAKAMATASDAYAKTVRAAGCVDPKLARMDVALEVLRRFGEHVRERHPDATEALTEALDSFGPVLAAAWD